MALPVLGAEACWLCKDPWQWVHRMLAYNSLSSHLWGAGDEAGSVSIKDDVEGTKGSPAEQTNLHIDACVCGGV